jgi:hypothetical protein
MADPLAGDDRSSFRIVALDYSFGGRGARPSLRNPNKVKTNHPSIPALTLGDMTAPDGF